jgi:hypothetical protein
MQPAIAKKVIAALEDRRSLWVTFDAEFPDRVRTSLDQVRTRLVDLRSELPEGEPLEKILLVLTKTIHVFFNAVEDTNLATLRCDSNDPGWCQFRDTLATLRKSVGLQISNLAIAYNIALSSDLQRISPRY